MPADIEVRRFAGLVTTTQNAEGELDQLIRADNVVFDANGIVEARPGLHFFTNCSVDQNITYVGKLDDFTGTSTRIFAGSGDGVNNRYFYWEGDKVTPELPEADAAIVPNNYDPGVQYGDTLYLEDGRTWDGTAVGTNAAQPTGIGAMAVHAERVWHATFAYPPNINRLRFSEPGDPTAWPAANFLDVGFGDTFITDLRSFQNRLYIFKWNAIYVLETPGVPNTWVLRKISDIGAQFRAVTEYEGVLYWVGNEAAYSFDGSTIQKISDPVEPLFESRPEIEFDIELESHLINGPVYRDNWVFSMWDGESFRNLCYHVKLQKWSEWVFEFQDDTNPGAFLPTSIWAEDRNAGDLRSGLYMTWGTDFLGSITHGMILGTELTFAFGSSPRDFFADETGTHIGGTDLDEHPYTVNLRTKFSDMGNGYDKKRVTAWTVEWEGGDILFSQTDEEERLVQDSLLGNPATPGIVHQYRTRGIGFFRRLSLQLQVDDFRDVGFRLYTMLGKMKSRGRQSASAAQDVS